MQQISLVMGQAGSGKTSWLASEIRCMAPCMLANERQRILGITRMHGARRRIDAKFAESCPGVPISVSTIHSFALSLVNKWRTALGHSRPIEITSAGADFQNSAFGMEATFDGILREATSLLRNRTVGSLLGATYPLIVIDEFQDCHGPLLEFVKAVASWSKLLVAGDDFQLLDPNVHGCPAVEWVKECQVQGHARVHDLGTQQHRFTTTIERAAQALRKGERAESATVPVVSCPKAPLAAWKIISNVALYGRWHGTTALIATSSEDAYLRDVLASCERQLKNKDREAINWSKERGTEAYRERILEQAKKILAGGYIEAQSDPLSSSAVERSKRYARLRGLAMVSDELLLRQVEAVIHERRAYQAPHKPKVVLTIHGAKNREFDNVFVLWGYKVPQSQDSQKRLLYNAVTRAKANCMVLVLDPDGRLADDPVLQLLGPSVPAFSKKKPLGPNVRTRRADAKKDRAR